MVGVCLDSTSTGVYFHRSRNIEGWAVVLAIFHALPKSRYPECNIDVDKNYAKYWKFREDRCVYKHPWNGLETSDSVDVYIELSFTRMSFYGSATLNFCVLSERIFEVVTRSVATMTDIQNVAWKWWKWYQNIKIVAKKNMAENALKIESETNDLVGVYLNLVR